MPALAAVGESAAPSPSQVVAAAEGLIAEIDVVRKALGVVDGYADMEPQSNRGPVHAYAKSLEVLHKVRRLQAQFGLTSAPPKWMPLHPVDSADVIANLEYLVENVRGIREALGFDSDPDRLPAPVASEEATLSTAYERLAVASLLLDGLRGGPLMPDDLFQVASIAYHDLQAIAERLEIALEVERNAPPSAGSAEIAQYLVRSIEGAIDVQAKLGMAASAAPNFTPVRVTSSEMYDLTGLLMAELSRISHHAGTNAAQRPMGEVSGKTLRDFHARIRQIHQGLEQFTDERIELALARINATTQELEGQQQTEDATQARAVAEAAAPGEDAAQAEVAPEEAPAQDQAVAESRPPCEIVFAGQSMRADYPRRGRRDLGSAIIEVRFQIDEKGETVDDGIEAVMDQSTATRARSIDLFARSATEAVEDWRFEFVDADELCERSQTLSVRFKFEFGS